MNSSLTLEVLQSQYVYELDVHIRKGEAIAGGIGKKIYRAEWLTNNDSPIILLEMKGNAASQEILLYITLDHPNIITTYGLVRPKIQERNLDTILLLQEFASDGDLSNMLGARIFIPTKPVLIEIFIQVSSAMIYLSNNRIVHGDLACRNVLVFKSDPTDPMKNRVKLIDFGLTRNGLVHSDASITIPVRYAAPEIIRSRGQSGYSEKSDVYSFAVLMWEASLTNTKIPFDNIFNDDDVARKKLSGEKLPRPDKCNDEIWKLMLQCWSDKPENRPTFEAIYAQLKRIQDSNSSSSSLTNCTPGALGRSDRYINSYSLHNLSNDQGVKRDVSSKQDRHARFGNSRENSEFSFADRYRGPSRSSYGFAQEIYSANLSPEKTYVVSGDSYDQESDLENSGDDLHQMSMNRRSTPSLKDQKQNRTELLKSSSSYWPKTNQASEYSSNIDVSYFREIVLPSAPLESHRQRSSAGRQEAIKFNPTKLPCEICQQLFDGSQLSTHQRQCLMKEKDRIEAKRKKIEEEGKLDREKAPCSYCNKSYFINELMGHQDVCPSNPVNVPSIPFKTSILRQNSRNPTTFPPVKTQPIRKERNPPTPSQSNTNQPSFIRRILTRLGFFKRK